jgi:hypothetical protein
LDGLTRLVAEKRLFYTSEVIKEFERYQGKDKPALQWAQLHQATACISKVNYATFGLVMQLVPEVLDYDKDSGVEEADAYLLALAVDLKNQDIDVRVVTEEFKTTVRKMPLGGAAGYLGIPSVPVRVLLKFEKILDF